MYDSALTNNWSQSKDNYARPTYPLTWENAGWKVVENSKDSYSIFYPDGSQLTGEWSTKEGAFDRVRMIAPEGSAKYSQYQLEGEKKNYKEILVTLPKPAFKKGEWFAIPIEIDGFFGKEIIWRLKNKNTGQEGVGAYETKELAESVIKEGEKSGGKTDFKSTHFEEPNILVHLRMNTRADADYNKVLFLEEIQSDWGQQGKRKGIYRDWETDRKSTRLNSSH